MQNEKCKTKNGGRAGFTLVEMLIATSLFSVVILTSTDIFLRVQRAQRQAAILEKTQDITRFFLTRVAQEVRSGSIDYEYYNDPGGLKNDQYTKQGNGQIASQTLALRTAEGERLLFKTRPKGDASCAPTTPDEDVSPCLIIATTAPVSQAERMNPPGYTIQKLLFVITPGSDPFSIDPATNDFQSNAQPKVTIMLTVQSTLAGIKQPFNLTTQTTVATREYRR